MGDSELVVPKKTCSNCEGPGPFGRSKVAKDGLKSHCKKCCAEKQTAYRAKHPETWVNWAASNAEHLKAKDAARYAANPEGEKARVFAYQTKNPEKVRAWQLLCRYGLTPEDKQALFEKQDGKCAVCSDLLKPGRTGTHLDHDHTTGKVRGLLCGLCNVMLGHFRDDPALLKNALVYLSQGFVVGLPIPAERPQGAEKTGTRVSNLWYGYGLTLESFQVLLDRQGGACGICRDPLKPGAGTHIDHDHTVGKKAGLRGLLCRSCNLGLGHSREGLQTLESAVGYLDERRVAA
jgi:hypothetical protein